jgi:hypothetical protein
MFPGHVDGVHVVVTVVGGLFGQNSVSERGAALQEKAQITPLTEASDNMVAVDKGLFARRVSLSTQAT